jgi:hypothetical protein
MKYLKGKTSKTININKKNKTNKMIKNKKHGGVKMTKPLNNNYSSLKNPVVFKNKDIEFKNKKIDLTQPKPTFVSTEGEDNLESSISFLLELMGSTLYETYVEEILNTEANQNIFVVQVPRPANPPQSLMIPGKPKIFYGSSKGTHFTCTLDGKNIWNSYKEGIQILNTDHFCQTFTLMRMQYQFLPNSFVGMEYNKLQKYQYLDNVMIALKVACYIIEMLQREFNIDSQVNELLQLRDNRGKPEHIKNPELKNIKSPQQIVTHLISYCRSITKEQMCNSTFKQKIFML